MSHTLTQVVMSLIAGFILGIAVFHLLPHSVDQLPKEHAIESAALWIAIGIVAMIVMLRVFDFHHHEFSSERTNDQDRSKDISRSVIGVLAGLSLHSITEGIALGTSVRIGLDHGGVLPGLGVCLVILLHKPLDAYSILALMRYQAVSKRIRTITNIGFALICPTLALITFLGLGALGDFGNGPIIGYALAFSVGAFLCISLSDLLPEIAFHRHDMGKLLAALFVGVGLAYGLFLIEEIAVHAH